MLLKILVQVAVFCRSWSLHEVINLQQKDNARFIDRSGELFDVVLEYLREGSAELPEKAPDAWPLYHSEARANDELQHANCGLRLELPLRTQ